MIYLTLFLLLLSGALLAFTLALVLAARHFVCNPMLRAARQIDTLIHQGVICGRCGNSVQGEARDHKRDNEVFFEVRSGGGARRMAVGTRSKDNYQQPTNRDEEETRVTARM
jgi:hypothetical protein